MTMRHPKARICNLKKNVHSLTGSDENGVLPYKVRLDDPVPAEHKKPAGTMNVKGVMHRMIGIRLVHEAYLHLVADFELPVDALVYMSRFAIHKLPVHIGGSREAVDLHHAVFPLNTVMTFC